MDKKAVKNQLGETFAIRLKSLLDAKGVSIEWLADKCGIPVKRIKYLLDKKNCPRIKEAIQMIKALKCTSDYLFGLKDL